MAQAHAYAYANLAHVEVAAVFGRTLPRAATIAEAVGAVATGDLRQALGESIDAVDVCLPTSVHPEFVLQALGAGKHVLCETPLALTPDDGQSMLKAARTADRLLLVGLLMRSVPAYEHVKEQVASGALGTPIAAGASRLGSYLRPDSADHKSHYGDPTTELMTFDFDVLNWLFGPPDRLTAVATAGLDGRPGHVVAVLRYADAVAHIEASGLMPVGFAYRVGFRIVGDEQAVEVATRFSGPGPPQTTVVSSPAHGDPSEVALVDTNPFETECRYFVDCVRGVADPALLDAERALDALQLSVATQQSIRTGQPATGPFTSPGRG